MPSIKMTDKAIENLTAPKGKRIEYFDAGYPGFGLRVSASNDKDNPKIRKTWVFLYRFGGKLHRLSFGPYPALTLANARKQASAALALVSDGKDPGAVHAAKKAEAARRPDTVANIVDDFIKRHLEAKKRAPAYIAGTRQNFDNHVLPRWGKRDIKAITRRDVIDLLNAVAEEGSDAPGKDGKKKHVDGGPIAANRVLAAIRALFNWAVSQDIISATPAALVRRPGEEQGRDRTLAADEIEAIWKAAGDIGTPIGDFFKVALLTGQRREEVATMRWADLDFDYKIPMRDGNKEVLLDCPVWTLPGTSTKNGKIHVVPLAPAVVEILKAMPRKAVKLESGGTASSPWVFTIGGDRPISGYSKAKIRIDDKITAARAEDGEPALDPWTIHDLRRTAATEMGRLEVQRFVIGKVLNHTDRSITGRYDKFEYLKEKRHALAVWAAYVDGLVNPRPAGDVADLSAVRAARGIA
jgi:integrase